ncbi:MAG: hypothetical protein KA144_09725, partial [Xanthomonadaceae bacterium]|nr:hypothetical protein [Xanthomonadaceae bacterium]
MAHRDPNSGHETVFSERRPRISPRMAGFEPVGMKNAFRYGKGASPTVPASRSLPHDRRLRQRRPSRHIMSANTVPFPAQSRMFGKY